MTAVEPMDFFSSLDAELTPTGGPLGPHNRDEPYCNDTMTSGLSTYRPNLGLSFSFSIPCYANFIHPRLSRLIR